MDPLELLLKDKGKKSRDGGDNLAQQVKAPATKSKYLSLLLETHMVAE